MTNKAPSFACSTQRSGGACSWKKDNHFASVSTRPGSNEVRGLRELGTMFNERCVGKLFGWEKVKLGQSGRG